MAPQHFGKHSVTAKILIYGATGYTGKLVSEQAQNNDGSTYLDWSAW